MGASLYTRRGDAGETSLVGGSRVPKNSLRVEAYGALDEANSWVGVARACTAHPVLAEALTFLQHRLFNCSSNLATPPGEGATPPTIATEDVAFLERAIDHFEERSGALTGFILPGGNQCAAFLHVARTVMRRAERRLVSLAAEEQVDPMVKKFINRASDFLFAAARYSNFVQSRSDAYWDKEIAPPALPSNKPPVSPKPEG